MPDRQNFDSAMWVLNSIKDAETMAEDFPSPSRRVALIGGADVRKSSEDFDGSEKFQSQLLCGDQIVGRDLLHD
jgi:hypothetical protein